MSSEFFLALSGYFLDHYEWKLLELGLKVYDQSQAHGHLKCQKLLFGWKRGIIYHIIYNTTT